MQLIKTTYGFTLIEVLVSIIVISTGILGLLMIQLKLIQIQQTANVTVYLAQKKINYFECRYAFQNSGGEVCNIFRGV